MQDYSFITIWKLNAPLEKVCNEIHNAEQWPKWWKGVEKVETVEAGEPNGMNSVRVFTFKSALPYKLSFHSRVTAVEYLQRIEGVAFFWVSWMDKASGHLLLPVTPQLFVTTGW